MANPKSVIDDLPMTKEEHRRLVDDMNWHDRQNSIEYVCEQIDELSEHASPAELWYVIKLIKGELSEFVE